MRTLLKGADILLRKENGYETLHGAYLGVDVAKIDYIGEEKPEKAYDLEKDMSGRLLAPGLINCHSHIAMTLMRGIGSGLPLQDWLFKAIFPIEDKLVREDIAAASRFALIEMIAGGTTSFSDMYFFPEETAWAVEEAGIKANLNRCVQCFDENQTVEQNTQIPESLALFEKYHGAADGRIHIDFSIHAEYTSNPPLWEWMAGYAAEHGLGMHVHVSETRSEHENCLQKYGKTPVALLDQYGVWANGGTAAHCVWVTDEDMELMARRGITAVHNPVSNLKLASGAARVPRLLERGVNVALGTDGVASNNSHDLFEEIKLAAILHKGIGLDPTAVTARQALEMATVNGARALGRNTGVIAPGKTADLILVDLAAPNLFPCHDVEEDLVYSARGSNVVMNMARGRVIYEKGEFFTLDLEKIRAEVEGYALPRIFGSVRGGGA